MAFPDLAPRRPAGAAVAAVLLLVLVACQSAARPAPAASAPLVLVSFDGFRWDYAARTETPNFDRLARDGVRAERLIPAFSSKTFTGHYTLATGLYPGHHGIISNTMRDPAWPEVFRLSDRREVEKERWWGGEPIWVTAKRQGLRAGSYFWPGSEGLVHGVRPDWWHPYDAAVAWDVRLAAAFDWLTQPAPGRASFVALYFEEPNDAGHTYGPGASETMAATRRADAILGQLLDGLATRGVSANVIVVSDHGMAQNDASRVIVLDDLVSLLPGELLEHGALAQIYPQAGREAHIARALEGAHPELAVYRREAVPAHLHLFDNPRVPPILLVPTAGWEVVPRSAMSEGGPGVAAGDHGTDPSHPDMHGIFYAAGPDISAGRVLGAVEQVDVYALMCRLLGIEPAPNDGVWQRIAGAVAAR